MCDGIDHCGDQSDESPALDCSMSGMVVVEVMMMMMMIMMMMTTRDGIDH